ncbi:MAG: hypothetical protein U5M23_07155 [Marinagarivorans sp.]|nr:hypothetical protein [Marinagarivorans sp.]
MKFLRFARMDSGCINSSWIKHSLMGVSLVSATNTFASDWNFDSDGTLYGYHIERDINNDSVLNPGNNIAHIHSATETLDFRYNLTAQYKNLRMSARPLIEKSHNNGSVESATMNSAYLGQWQLQLDVLDEWSISVGREVLHWGGGQYRSPSSAFYFDNGRSNPVRELSGVDVVKAVWGPSITTKITAGFVFDAGHGATADDPWQQTLMAKWDQQGETWAGGLLAAKPREGSAFVGSFGQWTISDAWLAYGEASSSRQPFALNSNGDLSVPFSVTENTPREISGLLGIAYTLESGSSLNVEWLHDGAGYAQEESTAYFDRAAMSPLNAGMALRYRPRLLNQNYLHMIWQTNLMDMDRYTRLMVTRNWDSGGTEIAIYTEQSLINQLAFFGMGVLNIDDDRSEFSSLFNHIYMIGLKVTLP